jgi:hypothetical protein
MYGIKGSSAKLGVLEEPGLVLDTGYVRCIPYVRTTVLGTYCAIDGGPIGQFLDQKICWNVWKGKSGVWRDWRHSPTPPRASHNCSSLSVNFDRPYQYDGSAGDGAAERLVNRGAIAINSFVSTPGYTMILHCNSVGILES